MLKSEASCREFLETQDPETIARKIRLDQESCRASRLPSLLALYLPPTNSELANAIALQLYPETSKYYRSIRMAQYSGMVDVIKGYLNHMTRTPQYEKLPTVVESLEPRRPSKNDIEAALSVLDFYLKSPETSQINPRTPFEDVVHVLQNTLKAPSPAQSHDTTVPSVAQATRGSRSKRKCYICQFLLVSNHPQYSSLCNPCGEFNLASCALSLPENLALNGKTALVTGARVNLGYHTALRLLRCGSKVIVTSRYPRDAEARYLAESDSAKWSEQLRIVGADFRAASDVFHLAAVVQECLRQWDGKGEGKLDILVNNAAQTLTDSLKKEGEAVKLEKRLQASENYGKLLLGEAGYEARIRGDVQGSRLLANGPKQNTMFLEASDTIHTPQDDTTAASSSQITTMTCRHEKRLSSPPGCNASIKSPTKTSSPPTQSTPSSP